MTTFRSSRRIEFRDTDAAGIAHFSTFFPFMEAVEHEFLRSLGLSVMPRGDVVVTWPRVSVACDYRGPARFEDLLDIDLRVTRLGDKSVTYAFDFTRDGHPIASGKITAVCCRYESGELHSISIPAEIRAQLAAYVSED